MTNLARNTVLTAAILSVFGAVPVSAQRVAIDTTKPIIAPEIIVTATRTPRALERVPVPLTVISARDIETLALPRLSDILENQLGMNLQYSRFGAAGIQLQGLDAAYTLVLLDGEPVATNVDGFADISRIPAASIERIEVTHGPSSSLYGSEALAGVVNIVTKRTRKPVAAGFTGQYGSNNSVDLNADVQTTGKRGSAGLFFNRLSSDGYDLFEDVPGNTVPASIGYNLTGRGDVRLSDTATLRGTGYASTQSVEGVSAIQAVSVDEEANPSLDRIDWNVTPGLTVKSDEIGRITLSSQLARSVVDANLDNDPRPELQDFLDFTQIRSETEAQLDRPLGLTYLGTLGGGIVHEAVEAEFIEGKNRSATSGFAFAQLEWIPTRALDVIGSARVDAHPDYATQLNPKIAASLTVSKPVRVQASVGRGFKAPTFEQRYINFTNTLGGSYTVLGSEGASEGLQLLQDAGLIAELLIDPSELEQISPESSWSFMTGVDYTPSESIRIEGLLFRNNVSNLIETRVVAVGISRQNIFSYTNIGNVYTQGFEVEGTWSSATGVSVSAGYQYLDAHSENFDSPLGGRSPHSGTGRIQFVSESLGADAYVFAKYRSSYPFITGADIQVDASLLLDVAASKQLGTGIRLTAGIRNVLDHTAPRFEPDQPGRTMFGQISYSFK